MSNLNNLFHHYQKQEVSQSFPRPFIILLFFCLISFSSICSFHYFTCLCWNQFWPKIKVYLQNLEHYKVSVAIILTLIFCFYGVENKTSFDPQFNSHISSLLCKKPCLESLKFFLVWYHFLTSSLLKSRLYSSRPIANVTFV